MAPNDIRDLLTATPYRPFRVWMSDGQSFEVADPTFAYVSTFALHLGTDFDDTGLPTSNLSLNIRQITQIEELPDQSAA